MNHYYDVIITGTGAGGGTLLNRIAPSRGKSWFWSAARSCLARRRIGATKIRSNTYSSEVMYNKEGGEIRPGFSYHVGGNTKVFGDKKF